MRVDRHLCVERTDCRIAPVPALVKEATMDARGAEFHGVDGEFFANTTTTNEAGATTEAAMMAAYIVHCRTLDFTPTYIEMRFKKVRSPPLVCRGVGGQFETPW
jgi:hypothetical protein